MIIICSSFKCKNNKYESDKYDNMKIVSLKYNFQLKCEEFYDFLFKNLDIIL